MNLRLKTCHDIMRQAAFDLDVTGCVFRRFRKNAVIEMYQRDNRRTAW